MKFIKVDSYKEMSRIAADFIADTLNEKLAAGKTPVLGLATGSTPIGTYDALVEKNKAGELDFTNVKTVNLDEYVGCAPDHPQGYRFFMNEHLFDRINIKKENTFVPDGLAKDTDKFCKEYDERIEKMGGVTLQLLGIGPDGHIGFNEPDSVFTVPTHVTGLTQSTIDANSRFFASKADVPTKAITMGIGPIMGAEKILMVVNGKAKEEVLMKALYGNIDPQVPASIIQVHKDVTVIYTEEK